MKIIINNKLNKMNKIKMKIKIINHKMNKNKMKIHVIIKKK